MRCDVKNAIKEIYFKLDHNIVSWDFITEPVELEKIIMDFCQRNSTKPGQIFYQVINGVLVMDGVYIGRIAPLLPKCEYSEKAAFYEDKILVQNRL